MMHGRDRRRARQASRRPLGESIPREAALHLFDPDSLSHILATWGYWAIFGIVALESAGVPMPGETILVAAAVYAGSKHGLDIRFVVLAAAAAAIVGDNIGYWAGRTIGQPLVRRYGPRVGLDSRRQALGQYLFSRYGGALVFFGRFAALLRTYAALLAGVNRLSVGTFFLWNAAGGIVWATVFGAGGYLLGQGIERIAGPIGWAALVAAAAGAGLLWRFYKAHEERLLAEAEREMGRAEDDARVRSHQGQ